MERWEALQKTCETTPEAPEKPAVSRCSRWSNRCFLSDVLSYECVDVDMQSTKHLQVGSVSGNAPKDKGCDILADVPGYDTYIKFKAATSGMHTFSLALGETLKGMQILSDDCQTAAATCVRCDGGPCETTSWLREGDIVVLIARNCSGDCDLHVTNRGS